MIVKNFELKKKNLKDFKFFLIYGNNRGLAEEIIQKEICLKLTSNYHRYEEMEILKDAFIALMQSASRPE